MTIKEEIKERTNNGQTKHEAQIEVGKRVKKLIYSEKTSKEVSEELGISESVVRSIRAKHENK